MQVLLFHKAWADGTYPAIRTLQHRHTSGSLPSSLFLTNYLPSRPHSPESQLLFEEMGHFWDWFFLIHEMPHSHVHRCTRAVWAFARLSLLCCAAFPFVLQVRTWPRSLLLCFFFLIFQSNISPSMHFTVSFYQLAHEKRQQKTNYAWIYKRARSKTPPISLLKTKLIHFPN